MSFISGQTLTAAQLNDLDIDSITVDDVVNAGAFQWKSFTGKFYQKNAATWEGNEITTSTNTCYYMELGGICFVWFYLVFSGSGTASNAIYMRTPIGLSSSIASVGGTYYLVDKSTSPDDVYVGTIAGHSVSGDLIKFMRAGWGVDVGLEELGDTIDIATTDVIRGSYWFSTDGTAAATT